MNKTTSRKRFNLPRKHNFFPLGNEKGQLSLDFIAGTVIFMVTFMFLFQTLTNMFVPFTSNSDENKSMVDRVAMTLVESTNGLIDSPDEHNIISLSRVMELNDRMNTSSDYDSLLTEIGLTSSTTSYNLNLTLRDPDGSLYEYQSNVVLNNGPEPPDTANVAQAIRVVHVKQEDDIAILYVKVW